MMVGMGVALVSGILESQLQRESGIVFLVGFCTHKYTDATTMFMSYIPWFATPIFAFASR